MSPFVCLLANVKVRMLPVVCEGDVDRVVVVVFERFRSYRTTCAAFAGLIEAIMYSDPVQRPVIQSCAGTPFAIWTGFPDAPVQPAPFHAHLTRRGAVRPGPFQLTHRFAGDAETPSPVCSMSRIGVTRPDPVSNHVRFVVMVPTLLRCQTLLPSMDPPTIVTPVVAPEVMPTPTAT